MGARPKRTAQPAPTQPCPSCGDTTIPLWRDESLWSITTTKTVEVPEIFPVDPRRSELMKKKKKKHAPWSMPSCFRCMKKGKQRDLESVNEANEELEAKDQGL